MHDRLGARFFKCDVTPCKAPHYVNSKQPLAPSQQAFHVKTLGLPLEPEVNITRRGNLALQRYREFTTLHKTEVVSAVFTNVCAYW